MYGLHFGWTLEYPERRKVTTNFKAEFKYRVGTLVYKAGSLYSLVDLEQVGTYTISRVTRHEVSSEQVASLVGDYTYRGFIGYAEGDGKIKGYSSGGKRLL